MFISKIQDTIQRYNLVKRDDKIILAVSGGPDSAALLDIFCKLRKQYNLKLHILHINHLIRKRASFKEALFVEGLAKKLKLPFHYYEKDAPAYAKENKLSLEEAARDIRREIYGQLFKELKADKIATGHNLDDHIETILMRIIRGASPAGLIGIQPASGYLIRPLIGASKDEILKYLRKNKIKYTKDESNKDIKFFRNKIRHKLIPLLEAEYNTNIKEALLRLSGLAKEDEEYLQSVADASRCFALRTGLIEIHADKIAKKHPAIIKRIIKSGVNLLLGHAKDLTNYHYEKIYELIRAQKGHKKLNLPNGLVAEKSYNKITIKSVGADPCVCPNSYSVQRPEPVEFTVPGSYKFDKWGLEINCAFAKKILKSGNYTAYFDFNKMGDDKLTLRARREGDRFTPLGMKGSKKIKDFLIDRKVPMEERDKIPLLAVKNDIIWIVGYRTSEKYKVTKDTKRILKIYASGHSRNTHLGR